MTISPTFHLLPGIVLLFSQYAVAWEVSCPAVIDTQSSAVSLKSDVPAAWQLSPRYMSRLWLSSIGVTQGKPENLMDLKPETKKVNGEIGLYGKQNVLAIKKPIAIGFRVFMVMNRYG